MRAPPLALAIILAITGCVAPNADPTDADAATSQVAYDANLTIGERVSIPSFDGTTIDAWVFRPDTTETNEKVPVIINYSPYWSNLAPPAASGGDAFSLFLIEYFVPRGYAVALVSARGTGLSEGCFTIGGPTELRDEDVVATFFGEQAWSNGNVTATGKSYDGTMAQGLLTRGNPHVKTIVPVSPISELYKYNYFDGVPYPNGVGTNTFNANYVLLTSLQQSTDPTDPTWQQTPTRLCEESADVQIGGLQGTLAGDYSPYWQARNYSKLLPDTVEASVFYIHGLSDFNVKPDHMVPWLEELDKRNVTVKMWLGNWEHEYPTRGDFNETLLRWFDQTLKGKVTGILNEPLVNIQDRDGTWRTENEWPPARATSLKLFPTASAKLGGASGSGEASYIDAPSAETPLGTIVYASEPLAEDLRLSGAPTMRAAISASGARATLAIALLADGKVVTQGFRDLAHRSNLAQAEPMQPGTTYDVLVHFFPQDVVLKKGSVLTLFVASHAPADALTDVSPAPTGARVTLHHGEKTFIEIPVVQVTPDTDESPQPDDVGCWAC